MDKLDSMLYKDYALQQTGASISSNAIATNLSDAVAERDALIGVLNKIISDLDAHFLQKTVDNVADVFFKNTALDYGNTTVTAWKGYNYITELDNSGPEDNVTYIDPTSFSCLNDHSSVFASGGTLITPTPGGAVNNCVVWPVGNFVCDCGVDGLKYVAASGASYDIGMNLTTVGLIGNSITSNIRKVSYYNAQYSETPPVNWDSDTYITVREADFVFTYDHLHKPITATGTYGVLAKIASITAGAATVTANKNKVDQVNDTYTKYSKWSKILDNFDPLLADVSFLSTITFSCSGDMTTTFPVSSSVMMDCGVDGIKGGDVSAVEYIPSWRSSYTKIVLTPDLINSTTQEMFLSSYLKSVSVSGTMILDNNDPGKDDVAFVDEITMLSHNDHTLDFPVGTSKVLCDNDIDGIFEFIVYSVEAKSDQSDCTIVTYTNGLPITANLRNVSIQAP